MASKVVNYEMMKPNRKVISFFCLGSILLIISLSIGISVGAVSVHTSTVWGIILNKFSPDLVEQTWSKGREAIVWDIRFPRTLLAIMVGSGLAIVGASLQSVTRNLLADPHLLGISSGGAFGAILALLHTGLFIGLIFLGDPKATHTVVFWMLGGLGLAQWNQLIYPLIVLLICGLWLFSQARVLNAMTVGDETASTLGINVTKFRFIIFVVCALITGVMVAFSGIIGFVGLMVPHIVRMFVGGDYFRVLSLSALLGAIFLLWADIAARTIMPPEDMPIGIVTGLVGGIFFVWLLRRK